LYLKARVLQLIDSFHQGGSERQAIQLSRLLHESGHYELYLASLKPEGILRPEVESLGLGEIPSYPLNNFYDRNAFAQLRRFAGYLRRSKIDLLHTHDFYTNIFGMVASFLAGVPVRIASCRETGGMRSRAQKQAQKLAYSLAHHIVANSEAVRQKLVEEGPGLRKITVIYNGLDLKRVVSQTSFSRDEALSALGLAVGPATRFVTIVANIRHEVKDYPMFLRSAQRVHETIPDAAFLLAGEGELTESIKNFAAELGISGDTHFLGRCENVAQVLNVSDVCVLSSKAEGFSNSILEYMAAGRPVVATDVGGAREAITEGETGYLVPSGNDRQMAEKIICLLRDPERARVMGKNGRRLVEQKFSCEAQLEKTEALYEKLLTVKRVPRRLQIESATSESV